MTGLGPLTFLAFHRQAGRRQTASSPQDALILLCSQATSDTTLETRPERGGGGGGGGCSERERESADGESALFSVA